MNRFNEQVPTLRCIAFEWLCRKFFKPSPFSSLKLPKVWNTTGKCETQLHRIRQASWLSQWQEKQGQKRHQPPVQGSAQVCRTRVLLRLLSLFPIYPISFATCQSLRGIDMIEDQRAISALFEYGKPEENLAYPRKPWTKAAWFI